MGGSPSFSQPRQSTNQSGLAPSAGSHQSGHTPSGHGLCQRTRARLIPRVPPPPARAMPTATRARLTPRAAAAAGAGYANNNQGLAHPGAAGAAAGAGYANHNQGLAYPYAAGRRRRRGLCEQQHVQSSPGMVNGYWNGNDSGAWGTTGYGSGVGAWGTGSPMYGWGYSGYSNPYSGGLLGRAAVRRPWPRSSPAAHLSRARRRPTITPSRSARPPRRPSRPSPARRPRRSTRPARRSRRATTPRPCSSTSRRSTQTPNDRSLHEFLALVFFAQGKYDQAAEPLYAVLSVGPGWDWTTLSGMYPDVETYTGQLRALEANVRANPESAHARFVLAYQYLCQGHVENAVAQLKEAVKLQPGDTLSAQLIAYYQPAGGSPASVRRAGHERCAGRSRESWPGAGRPRRARTRRSPWRSRTTANSTGTLRARASRRPRSQARQPSPTESSPSRPREVRTARWPERWPGRTPTTSPSDSSAHRRPTRG